MTDFEIFEKALEEYENSIKKCDNKTNTECIHKTKNNR